jgi:hypothetical protein
MKSRTAFLLLAATGCLAAAGCSGRTAPGGEEGAVGSATMSLKRMQNCGDLEATLKADARAKMNRQIDAMIEGVNRGYYAGGGFGGGGTVGVAESGAPKDSAGTPAPAPPASPTSGSSGSASGGNAASSPGSSATSHSETNNQVAGVDEADIVKTNGKYIYLLHGQSFSVLNAWPSNELANAGSLDIEGSPHEMFVEGNHAVVYSRVNGTPIYAAAGVKPRDGYSDGRAYSTSVGAIDAAAPAPDGIGGGYFAQPLTKITVLTLEGTNAKVAREMYFEGEYLSSRRVDNHVRTVLTGGAHGPSLKYWFDYKPTGGAEIPYPQTKEEYVAFYERLRAENNAAIDATTSADWLPYMMTKQGSAITATTQKCEDLWVPPTGTTQYGLTQVEAIDLNAPEEAPKGQAIMGAVDTVYSSSNAMYLAARGWNDPFTTMFASGWGGTATTTAPPNAGVASPPSAGSGGTPAVPPPDPIPKPFAPRLSPQSTPAEVPDTIVTLNYTHLHKFDLARDPSSPEYVASGTVPGSIKDQFSMDERNGVLRIATTEQKVNLSPSGPPVSTTSPSGPPVSSASPPASRPNPNSNNVFTLAQAGSTLARQGGIVNLAPTETIFSTRFVGRYGYVVTFRRTDPLFVVDLETPSAPALVGELEIPGFSEYMHPIDDGHLLTIGRDADSNGRTAGLALQIFDVTNPRAPRQAFKYTFNGSEYGNSEASYDHKAFTYFADKKLLAFPYVAYGQGTMRSSLEVFDIDLAKGITKRGSVDHSALFGSNMRGYCGGYFGPNVRRGVFLENIVYSISYAGVVASDVANLATPVSSLVLPSPKDVNYASCGYPGDVIAVPPTPEPAPKGL